MKNLAIFCLHYGWLTGSEMYFYELVKLLKDDYNVTLYSNIDYRLSDITILNNVTFCDLKETHESMEYDLIIVSHGNFLINNIKKSVKNFENTPVINICHSEILPQEEPLILDNVRNYIAIRPSIVSKLIEKNKIPPNKIRLIYNPIDVKRFNLNSVSTEDFGLFIGTMNHLRIKPLVDFIDKCKEKKLSVRYIGDVNEDFKKQFNNVEFLKPLWEVEYYIKKSNICGGIINGRTFWEAKLCGKDVLEYNVDSNGNILNVDDGKSYDIECVKDVFVKKQIIELLW
jgi:hypothetical protein